MIRIGLETQFFCAADPAGWDPIYGKSPVHFAGDIHNAALQKALELKKGDNKDERFGSKGEDEHGQKSA